MNMSCVDLSCPNVRIDSCEDPKDVIDVTKNPTKAGGSTNDDEFASTNSGQIRPEY